ncbi:MAG: flagellar hook capping FlgD N-terminal domain-containing protein [Pseudomonadota bacterium]
MTSINNALPSGLTRAQPVNATGGETLDQAAFLKLMTAQLRYQDPFDPVDNQAMVAQMAQFSSVAGIAEMNVSLQQIANSFNSIGMADAAQFIGRSALVPGDMAAMDPEGVYAGEIVMAGPVDELTVELVDGAGNVVHAETMRNVPAGAMPFRFESGREDGKPVDSGPLKVRVGGGYASQISTWLPVSAVAASGDSNGAALITPIGQIPANQAQRIG